MSESKKLEKLTPEQEALMPVVRDEWINLSLNSGKAVQEHEIREVIDGLYKVSGLPEHPMILIFDSFIGMELGYNRLQALGENSVYNPVRHSVRKPVDRYAFQSWFFSYYNKSVDKDMLAIAEERMGRPLYNSVFQAVTRPMRNSVKNSVENSHLTFVDDFTGLGSYGRWFSSFDYFSRIGIINDNDKNFNIYRDMVRAGIWTSCYYEHCVLVCRLPTKVSKDEQGRLHSTTGPAVQWRDGSGQYFIHGVNFSQNIEEHISEPKLWKKIVSKELSLTEILMISNIEQRYVALKLHGAEKLLQDARAQLIDKSKRGNELYEIENLIRDRTLKLLKYKDPSTDRIYVIFVPYEYEKADEAMAWKFQLNEEEYKLLKVEA